MPNHASSTNDDCPTIKPKEMYNPMKYPDLAADFFEDKGDFYQPEQKEAHLPDEPEQCPVPVEVNKDCDYGEEPIYAECVIQEDSSSVVKQGITGTIKFLQFPNVEAAVGADVTGLRPGDRYGFGVHQYG